MLGSSNLASLALWSLEALGTASSEYSILLDTFAPADAIGDTTTDIRSFVHTGDKGFAKIL